MQAAHDTESRARDAILREGGRVNPGRAHDLCVEGAREKPALVHVWCRLEQQCTGDARNVVNFQGFTPA